MKGALQLVFPPQCMGCGDSVISDGALCPVCWRDTQFITGTACDRCGVPLPSTGAPEENLALSCDDCLSYARPWQQGRAALGYHGTGKRLVMMLKHGDRLDMAPNLGDWLAEAAAPLVAEGMLVVPVPLHLRRLAKRKYNQAALLAERVARQHQLRHVPTLLARSRHAPPQDRRNFSERFANQAGTFTVPARHRALLRGRPILLIDDVMASGATLSAAAECLRAHESGPVSVAVLARALKDA
ncbi:competence protein F [Paracoccus aminophilus JCM 7686]|uniref:Competence protein F n=2 Tax=Paracoccus aminophilus TaxID=34003 RepID=S5XRI8_PARAH|nr:competence protein F [Paracoccus aminophilus JCM 7686]